MAVSKMKSVFEVSEEDYGFSTLTIDTQKTLEIPLYIPTLMPLIEKEAPKVKSEVIRNMAIYINSPDVAVHPSNSVLVQNYIVPICDRQEDMVKQSERSDGILLTGSRIPISMPFKSIKEIHIKWRKKARGLGKPPAALVLSPK